MSASSPTLLSICIPTFNRAGFIGATLDSILGQISPGCEIVVLDGGSTDNTETVMSQYTGRAPCIRYVRQAVNNGFDRDCDRAVELATGEYCWLMTDDDLLKPGALAAVVTHLRRDPSLVIVNVETRDLDASKLLQRKWINVESDRVYRGDEMDRLFVDVGDVFRYVGCVVIKRRLWLSRDRQRYYGSWYIYVGVIFQQPLPGEALVIAEPYIAYRRGNTHTFSTQVITVLWLTWPAIVGSLPLSDLTKRKVCNPRPWTDLNELLLRRALGHYSVNEYRLLIRPKLKSIREMLAPALVVRIPGVVLWVSFLIYYSLTTQLYRGVWEPHELVLYLRQSRFNPSNYRIFRRARSASL